MRLTGTFPSEYGGYILAGSLGQGGMGEVCLAVRPGERPVEERLCVIKRSLPDALGRFRQELEVAGQLDHEAVVRVLDAGEKDGEPYLVQEFVEGLDLGDLPRSLVPTNVAVFICAQIARALAYVHTFRGERLVHRDVAPANIRLGANGSVKLIDFGLVTSPELAGLTAPGNVLWGRSVYEPPEARQGHEADAQGDVYSLGVVLWELLVHRAHENAAPPPRPRAINAELSVVLDEVVAKATASDRQERFADAKALADALEESLPRNFNGRDAVRALVVGAKPYVAEKDRLHGLLAEVAAYEELLRPVRRARDSHRWYVLVGAAAFAVILGAVVIRAAGRQPPPRREPPAVAAASPRPPETLPVPGAESVAAGQREAPPIAAAPRPARTRAARPPVLMRAPPAPEEASAAVTPAEPPVDGEALLGEARIDFRKGDLAAAERSARAALRVFGSGPRAAAAEYLLGNVYFGRGDYLLAERAFKAALEGDPSHKGAAAGIEAARAAARRIGAAPVAN